MPPVVPQNTPIYHRRCGVSYRLRSTALRALYWPGLPPNSMGEPWGAFLNTKLDNWVPTIPSADAYMRWNVHTLDPNAWVEILLDVHNLGCRSHLPWVDDWAVDLVSRLRSMDAGFLSVSEFLASAVVHEALQSLGTGISQGEWLLPLMDLLTVRDQKFFIVAQIECAKNPENVLWQRKACVDAILPDSSRLFALQ
ncbi:MAG: hypothetical protein LR015_10655 [Verrucomicrobia bacterium]|nr:hypothetical protein [Verrucomicrobiota bacterium]